MLILSDSALSILSNLDRQDRRLIGGEIRKFQDEKPVNLKKLKGEKNKWRLAAGDWRIILKTEKLDEDTVMIVTDIVKRKDAYKR